LFLGKFYPTIKNKKKSENKNFTRKDSLHQLRCNWLLNTWGKAIFKGYAP